jgi:hypothetical protein
MKKKQKFSGYKLIGNRITSSRQARQMLGRLAGLKSARKQRKLGWPNLKKATEARRRNAEWRRFRREFESRAAEQGVPPAEREELWRELLRPEPRSIMGIKPVDLRMRGMTLIEARRRGLLSR